MTKRLAAVVLICVVAGCTRTVDNPRATPQASIGPIAAGQVADLLSPDIQNRDGNRFAVVVPAGCAGTALEVDPPFLVDHGPAAEDGGHWSGVGGSSEVVNEEMVAVYPSDFSAADALASARRVIESCTGSEVDVTTMADRTYTFTVEAPAVPAPAGSVLWSLRSTEWNCDNLVVAAYNAAIEATSCGPSGGMDTVAAAEQALERIEMLADNTA
ncbi:sensor domain-containing protein [Arthrobacter sp. SLBN-53]|uniref:sensor domain-containing protein n=1 Tax=Arthrobacter sp. SLBN-53 TaxID=2768412 RepID=UPI0011686AB0|nr:sensor domain-containing protein [Arthrobacter sp. SLBN-53]TQK27479.1 PknH-like protein [Arthrobacter sp. SLBN-53]